MSRAFAWIRKSKGEESDNGLGERRELVRVLADDLADELELLDLGVHTGFSTITRDDPAGLLDQNERVQECVSKLEAGEYSHLARGIAPNLPRRVLLGDPVRGRTG